MHRRWDKSKPPVGPFALNKDCIQAQGLVNWWPMGGASTANFVPDLCGNAHMQPGTSGKMSAGKYGEPVIDLAAASSQYLTTTAPPVTSYPFSASIWFNPTTLTTSGLMGCGNSSNNGKYWYIVLMSGGTIRAQITDTDFANIAETTATCSVGQWSNAINVYTSDVLRTVYLNGSNAVSNTGSNAYPSALTNTALGCFSRSSNSLFTDSKLGEAAIWNVALTPEQIAAINDPGTRFELWYPLRSRKWISISSDVSLSLSGLSASCSKGSVSPSLSNALTGQSVTASSGSVSPEQVIALIGAALSAAGGSLAPSNELALSGLSLTLSAGEVTAGINDISLTLTGLQVGSAIGSLSPSSSITLTGQQAVIALGDLLPVLQLALSGLVSSSALGSLSSGLSIALSGLSQNASGGNLAPTTAVNVPGAEISIQQGSLSPIISAILSGQTITAETGTLTVINNDVTLTLNGQSLSIVAGSLVPSLDKSLTGQSITLNTGTLIPEIQRLLSGQNLDFSQGAVGVNIDLTLAGRAVTLSIGNVALTADRTSVEWVIVEKQSNTIIACSQPNSLIVEAQYGKIIV